MTTNVRGRGYDKDIRPGGKSMVRNKIVRDDLKSSAQKYDDNYDRIFRKKDDKAGS